METLRSALAIFLVALVVKLMDDYIDQEIDRLNGHHSLAVKLKRGIVPYTLIFFSFSILLDAYLSISLFWASYIVGMGTTNESLSSRLWSYQEIILLSGLGFWVLGHQEFLFALGIILFIQLMDDYIDYYRKEYVNRDNFINYLGKLGTLLLAVLAITVAISIDLEKSVLVILVTLIIGILLKS